MIRSLGIPRGSIELAADLHLPDSFDETTLSSAVVLSTPGSSVKEQIGANYASRLAARGIPALVFDPAFQGQSGGEPRDLEDPYQRSEDISYAIDTLGALPGIDPKRIGILGICAGGGYAIYTSRTDHRIKAVATVVASNIGTAFRSFQLDGPVAALDALARQRLEESRSGELTRENWLPGSLEDAAAVGATDLDTTQAITYYRTDRGHNEHTTNRRVSRADALLLGFDALHLVDQLMTQPLQVIIAGRRGNTDQYQTGTQLWEMAPNPVDRMIIDGAGHYEMYDVSEYVDAAVNRLASFYNDHLSPHEPGRENASGPPPSSIGAHCRPGDAEQTL